MDVNIEKIDKVTNFLKNLGKAAVMLSGGVDSSVLTYLAVKASGPENVIAITVNSPLTFKIDVDFACKVTKLLNVRHLIVQVDELSNINIALNTPLRCYYCKKMRIKVIREALKAHGYDHFKIIDGTNIDEAHGRPGLKALKEEGVYSPYLMFDVTKNEIRELACRFSLPTAHKPPNSCKATRIELFTPLRREILDLIEELEIEVGKLLGNATLRARMSNGYIRIEVPEDVMHRVFNLRHEIMRIIEDKGFKGVTLSLKPYARR
ncbi:MAG: ATP-dependent sacrificial sulfur transferase LarE [Thermoprotei archaeon]|nr:MAG: ATP-dependent sacrificial sulfur transferase LarE [Thermoprotei archaeon]